MDPYLLEGFLRTVTYGRLQYRDHFQNALAADVEFLGDEKQHLSLDINSVRIPSPIKIARLLTIIYFFQLSFRLIIQEKGC
jgi:hypothetical protein